MALGASRAIGGRSGTWGKVFRIRPLNALASQAASATVVLSASALGMPVSTSHIISTALMGSGAIERVNKVR
jgi:PiT family inorganic phosphate transporter